MTMVRPYGDTMNDGYVQLSFTLPIPDSPRARESARQLVLKLGFFSCEIVHTEPLDGGFTMFIAYARTEEGVDPDAIVVDEGAGESMTFDEVNEFIAERIGRKIVVVGACTGFDAHTVGIDAIMNMKGYNHHFGLERYPMVEAYNLGAQVRNELLIERAVALDADAILVSQVVTQKDAHVKNLTELVELLEAEGLRDKFILIMGGPRIGQKLARELGFDAGFGKGTYAENVATFIANRLA
ncbi:MAG TPA: OAM dimerization domain-containing protein [Candidatus Anoxymicrobiaceae bacterium]|jgi:beta-lysine 5,6-aminomutase beta subunit